MIVITWNCRDAGNRNFPNIAKQIVRDFHGNILCLVETRISGDMAKKVVRKLRFSNWHRVEASGFAGGIWVLWDDSRFQVQYVDLNTQYIHCHITDISNSEECLLTFVYGETTQYKRKPLWEALERLATSVSLPWLVCADLNAF